MAKKEMSRYRCGECGYVSLTMVGKCPGCGVWGSMEEEAPIALTKEGRPAAVKPASPLRGLDVEEQKRNECEQKQNVKAELVKHDANSKWCKIRGVNYSGKWLVVSG